MQPTWGESESAWVITVKLAVAPNPVAVKILTGGPHVPPTPRQLAIIEEIRQLSESAATLIALDAQRVAKSQMGKAFKLRDFFIMIYGAVVPRIRDAVDNYFFVLSRSNLDYTNGIATLVKNSSQAATCSVAIALSETEWDATAAWDQLIEQAIATTDVVSQPQKKSRNRNDEALPKVAPKANYAPPHWDKSCNLWTTNISCPAYGQLEVVIQTGGPESPPTARQLAVLDVIASLSKTIRKPIRSQMRRYVTELFGADDADSFEPADFNVSFTAATIPPLRDLPDAWFFLSGESDLDVEHGVACLSKNGTAFNACSPDEVHASRPWDDDSLGELLQG